MAEQQFEAREHEKIRLSGNDQMRQKSSGPETTPTFCSRLTDVSAVCFRTADGIQPLFHIVDFLHEYGTPLQTKP